jgi:hypothetical protein
MILKTSYRILKGMMVTMTIAMKWTLARIVLPVRDVYIVRTLLDMMAMRCKNGNFECMCTLISMAVTTAKVRENVSISWTILPLVMRLEREELVPLLEALILQAKSIAEEIVETQRIAEELIEPMKRILLEAEEVSKEVMPIWDDSYNLCGNPSCEGDCRVCQEGEEDYEDSYTEKYCKRGRR